MLSLGPSPVVGIVAGDPAEAECISAYDGHVPIIRPWFSEEIDMRVGRGRYQRL